MSQINEQANTPFSINQFLTDKGLSSSLDYTRHIMEKQLKPWEVRLTKSIKVTLSDGPTWLYKGGGLVDHAFTYTRSFKVYADFWANFIYNGEHNNDADHPLSAYYQLMTVNGQGTPLTDLGWAAFSLGIIALPVGMVIEVYRHYRKHTEASLYYHQRRLRELGVVYEDDNKFQEDIRTEYKSFLDRRKVVNRLTQKPAYEQGAEDNANYENKTLSRASGFVSNRFNIQERNTALDMLGADYDFNPEHKPEYKLMEKFDKVVAVINLSVKRIWDLINDASYAYWLVWFAFVSLSVVTVSIPLIFGITMGITGMYCVPRVFNLIKNFRKTDKQIEEDEYKSKLKTELERMGAELKDRHMMKKEHDLFRSNFGLQKRPKDVIDQLRPDTQPTILSRTKQRVQNSNLARYLKQGSGEHLLTAVAVDVVNAIIATSFSFWVLSAAATTFGGALVPLIAFFDNAIISGWVGIGIGGLYGFKKYVELKTAQKDFEQRIHEKLSEKYEKTGETRLECFERLEREVEFNRAHAEFLKLQVLFTRQKELVPGTNAAGIKKLLNRYAVCFEDEAKNKINNGYVSKYKSMYFTLREARENVEKNFNRSQELDKSLGNGYDLGKIDVYNHEYREKQRYEAGWWTTIKRVGNDVYTILAGAQSGSLLVRTLFTKICVFGALTAGGTAAAVMTGTLPIFIGVALAVSIIYAGVYYYNYKLEKEHKHKEKFLDNMDGNISYLKKKNKEVTWLKNHLNHSLQENAVEKPVQEQGKTTDDHPTRVVSYLSPVSKNTNAFHQTGLSQTQNEQTVTQQLLKVM